MSSSSPYLRALAQLQHRYQSFLVSADAYAARINVIAAEASEVERVRGDVKNHVKKGGWSPKRYQRRRANEIAALRQEVADVLTRVVDEACIMRIVRLGAREAIDELGEEGEVAALLRY